MKPSLNICLKVKHTVLFTDNLFNCFKLSGKVLEKNSKNGEADSRKRFCYLGFPANHFVTGFCRKKSQRFNHFENLNKFIWFLDNN